MLDAEFLATITERAEYVAGQLHDDIIARVVERITWHLVNNKKYLLTASDKWRIETLTAAGLLLHDIEKEVAKKTGLEDKEIRQAFRDAGIRSVRYDNEVFRDAGISAKALLQSPAMIRVLERDYKKTLGEWKNYTGTTVRSAYQLFINECDKAMVQVRSGAETWGQAYMRAVDEISKNGVEVVYPSGHRDTIETATARALRTGVSQSTGSITVARAMENDIVCFITTSHFDPRPTHYPWQGQVFWIDWDALQQIEGITGYHAKASPELKAKYKEFVSTTGYGTVTGLCGANCRHSFLPFVDGVSQNHMPVFDEKEARKEYELRQKQRALERGIRKTKRDKLSLETAIDNCDDEVTKTELQKSLLKTQNRLKLQNQNYIKFCDDNKLKTQEVRLKLAAS